MYDTYKSQIWKNYGFRDAFNLGQNWWGPDVIGIDEGPIIIMMENYRNGSVWNAFMQNEDIQVGLERAGFQEVTSIYENIEKMPLLFSLEQNYPNPFNGQTQITFQVPENKLVNLSVFDVTGRKVAVVMNKFISAGEHRLSFKAEKLNSGIYFYRLEMNGESLTKRMLLLK